MATKAKTTKQLLEEINVKLDRIEIVVRQVAASSGVAPNTPQPSTPLPGGGAISSGDTNPTINGA